jgi:hypothetical protein
MVLIDPTEVDKGQHACAANSGLLFPLILDTQRTLLMYCGVA